MPYILRLPEDPAKPPSEGKKASFLQKLERGDEFYLELGGASDRLALAAIAYGATVYRYPSFKMGPEAVLELIERYGLTLEQEKAFGEETSDKLTSRKARALGLFALSFADKEGFFKAEARDVRNLQLKIAFRAYRRSQKAAIRAYQGLLSAYRDQAFLDLAFTRQEAAKVSKEEIHNYILENLLSDMLGGEVSEDERCDFFALIGKEFEGGQIPENATEEDIAKIVDALLESDRFHATVFDRLKSQQKSIERLLKGGKVVRPGRSPEKIEANEIYEKVFEPIPGCGPLISARVMSSVVDIRRFPTFPKFKAFAGYHFLLEEDGTWSRARRRAGHVSNWHPELKQAVYLFCEQTFKMKDSPWRQKVDARKAFELWKILKHRQAEAKEDGLNYEILPKEFASRVITSVCDMTPSDYAVYEPTGKKTTKGDDILKLTGGLAFHVDQLRKAAGVTSDEVNEEDNKVKDPILAKLVRGVKQQAHDRARRWLGQQFLRHIYGEWRKALGLPELPLKPAPKTSGRFLPEATTT